MSEARQPSTSPSTEPVPAGLVDFDLPLGRMLLRVLQLPTSWDGFVHAHYEPFCQQVDRSRQPDLTVTVHSGSGVVVPVPPPGGTTELTVRAESAGRFRIQSHWQDGTIDVAARRGDVTLTDRGHFRFRMSLENYLRVASQLVAIEQDAFLMHSAGVVHDGKVCLFFGQSGAGKSTTTQLSAPRPALSDDMVLLDVSHQRATAHAVPFYGAFPPHERLRGEFPVVGAFRLRQAPEDRLVRLSPARAVAALSGSIPFVHEFGVPHEGLTALAARFCALVPIYELYFTKSPRFWDLIVSELR